MAEVEALFQVHGLLGEFIVEPAVGVVSGALDLYQAENLTGPAYCSIQKNLAAGGFFEMPLRPCPADVKVGAHGLGAEAAALDCEAGR